MSKIAHLFRHLLPARTALLLVAYTVLLLISLVLAYELRFDFYIPPIWQNLLLENLLWIIPLKLLMLFLFGQFGGLLSYFRLPDLNRVFAALGFTSFLLVFAWYATDDWRCPPRSVILGDLIFSFTLIVAFRLSLRVIRERYFSGNFMLNKPTKRIAIVGAGDAGAAIAADLLNRRGLGMRPVVFLDDDKKKWRKHVHGITVMDSPDNLEAIKRKFGIESIIIAMPSATPRRIREIIQEARRIGVSSEIVPSLAELTTGRVRASLVRPVDIEDLLGREPVELDSGHIKEMIANKVIMVTGAGGSIGSELSRQVLSYNPKRVLLIEQSENQLFEIEQHLIEEGFGSIIHPLIADILDSERIRSVIQKFSPQIIFHAAAHKHVFLVERQPQEAVKNNIFGTRLLADLASEFNVERFILISTDKAVNPTGVMGATKRLAEIYIQARQSAPGNRTKFMAVRFGNVLGSSGSVVPIFKKQIAQGGPVKVTHADVTRYFMTIPEAVGLVLQSATQGAGGEIFVLDMGKPVKIIDLARQLIELSGYRPDIDIEIEFTGLKPGEKLFEEIQHIGETLAETKHPRILRFQCSPLSLDQVQTFLQALSANLDSLSRDHIKRELQKLVPEYTPYLE